MMVRFFTMLLVLLLPSMALAQTAPTARQKALNREAYEAMQNDDAARAIELYRESLAIAPLNITYLNLGRAYQKSGQCMKAWEAFGALPAAPQVASPAPAVIADTANRFSSELAAACPTQIEVVCGNDGATVAVGTERKPCPATFEVTPGTHQVRMTWDVVQREQEILVGPGRVARVEFDAEPVAEPAAEPVAEPVAETTGVVLEPPVADASATMPPRSTDWAAWALIGSGVVIGVTAALLDGVLPRWPKYAHDYQLTAADFVPAGGYVIAVSAIAIGIWDLLDGPEP